MAAFTSKTSSDLVH